MEIHVWMAFENAPCHSWFIEYWSFIQLFEFLNSFISLKLSYEVWSFLGLEYFRLHGCFCNELTSECYVQFDYSPVANCRVRLSSIFFTYNHLFHIDLWWTWILSVIIHEKWVFHHMTFKLIKCTQFVPTCRLKSLISRVYQVHWMSWSIKPDAFWENI